MGDHIEICRRLGPATYFQSRFLIAFQAIFFGDRKTAATQSYGTRRAFSGVSLYRVSTYGCTRSSATINRSYAKACSQSSHHDFLHPVENKKKQLLPHHKYRPHREPIQQQNEGALTRRHGELQRFLSPAHRVRRQRCDVRVRLLRAAEIHVQQDCGRLHIGIELLIATLGELRGGGARFHEGHHSKLVVSNTRRSATNRQM